MTRPQLNLKTALTALFVSMFALSVLQGGLAYSKLGGVAARTDELLDVQMPAIDEAHAIGLLLTRARLWQFRYMMAEDAAERSESSTKTSDFLAEAARKVEAYGTVAGRGDGKDARGDLVSRLDVLRSDWDRVRSIPAAHSAEALSFFRGQMNANYLAALTVARSLVDMRLAAGRSGATEIRTQQASAANSTLLMLGVSALVAAAATAFSLLAVSRPIARMAEAMLKLAAGDSASAIPYGGRRDEIGSMARAVAVFRDNLVRSRRIEDETAQARLAAEEQRRSAMRQVADDFERAVG
ncbi:MAG: HAMP domain-containing protein, partial [Parafilimonas terrae]|nr:HAMP domain-containing protein [Parafilimonas terrae]